MSCSRIGASETTGEYCMAEFKIHCACTAVTIQNCQPGDVLSSVARHPTKGTMLVSCFHGPACMAEKCACSPKHSPYHVAGERLSVIAEEARDVAWFSLPAAASGISPRQLASSRPRIAEDVVIILRDGTRQAAKVLAIAYRDDDPAMPLELQVSCNLECGDSGGPVLNQHDELVAVVRNSGGRCGFVARRLMTRDRWRVCRCSRWLANRSLQSDSRAIVSALRALFS